MRPTFKELLTEKKDSKAEYTSNEKAAYKALAQLQSRIADLEKSLPKLRAAFDKNPVNWSYVSTIGQIARRLESVEDDVYELTRLNIKESVEINEKKLPKTKDFFKQYTNLKLSDYSRYWALFAFMYDEFKNLNDNDAIDKLFQAQYDKWKQKDKRYFDAWKYFAAFKRQELIGKTEGSFVTEELHEQITYAYQIALRNAYFESKETN